MIWMQKKIDLKPRPRGFHLITNDIMDQLPEIKAISIGMMNIFIKHTSASITINENADPSVRQDFESFFNQCVKENEPFYTHVFEGSDDMPAHLKGSILGFSQNLPISKGKLNLGIWQGVYLCEHRDNASSRSLILTIQGQE